MNKNVIEILTLLMQIFIDKIDLLSLKKDITESLEEQGYEREDINKAFEFMYKDPFNVSDKDFYTDQKESGYNRVFSKIEKMYFDDEVKTIIYQLNKLGILDTEELEIIIDQMLSMAFFNNLTLESIWELIDDVVDDDYQLYIISESIDFFNGNAIKFQMVN
ncbi:DUF494 domain-containing protein [Halanaerobium sp. Z-7514]|uniref:DUF494 domain-containing protein n=1 Tax=Halanaerobium polyolivorans TaxID=2886943 RepID=A0AAW4WVM3_9FIRM|nr:DUF494 family protein [Halanaerobium polyolivorans]MCC3143816.1 DUF494 domain-containing protein [Halanaerobium polyolivorans]RQD77357.1 MAG: DUF494 family protein [Halanaerobium sp. MSAO_Bac5]